MPLHPQVEALRGPFAGGPRLHELSVEEARADDQAETVLLGRPLEPEPVAEVADRLIQGAAGDLPVRLYRPEAQGALPVLVYFHGGGWVLGSPAKVEPLCRAVANAVPCAVVAPAYRRAPEHPFPAAVEDARAATVWVVDQAEALGLDAERIAVGGSSAGGNLAAAVTLLLRHQAPRLVFQLLVYPPLDARAADEGDDPRFGREDVAWCWSHYLSDPADGEDARASPLRAADLSGLPPALVVTAEHDPLRSEGERYAERLRAAGVQAKVARFDGMPHGFLGLALDAARDAFDLAAAELRRAFDAEPPLIAATTEE